VFKKSLAIAGLLAAHCIAGLAAPVTEDAASSAQGNNKKTVIYSDFGDDPSCSQPSGWTLGGKSSAMPQSMAMPFTPSVSTMVTKVKVAIVTYGGGELTIGIHEDAGGLPGNSIKKFSVTDFPSAQDSCAFVSKTFAGVPVVAGKQYWLKVHAPGKDSQFFGFWRFGYSDLASVAGSDGNGWHTVTAAMGAFAILGD